MEEWKPVKGFEDRYMVSNLGRVKSIRHASIIRDKILSLSNHNQGYLSCSISRGAKKLVHRIVAESFIENPLNKAFVNHINGDKKNNHSTNLEWCTRKENEKHAYSTGLKNSTGSNNTMSKLSEEDVIKIKFFGNQLHSSSLASSFSVTTATINRIRSGVIWKHVNERMMFDYLKKRKIDLFSAEKETILRSI